MAKFIGYIDVNVFQIDLNFYVRDYVSSGLTTGVNTSYYGAYVHDTFYVNGNDGFDDQKLFLGGFNLRVNADDEPTGGRVTVMAEIDNGGSELWTLVNTSVPMVDIYNAAATTTRSDDLKLVSRMFNGNDVLKLSDSSDKMNGYGGNDRMFGGGGNDRLNGGAGNDLLVGDGGKDVLIGASGDDMFIGRAGRDFIITGSGSDVIRFERRSDGRDTVKDFAAGDKFQFKNAVFGGLGTGQLDASHFLSTDSNHATTADQRFIYDTGTSVLWYDPDGNGGHAAEAVAILKNGFDLHASDIFIF